MLKRLLNLLLFEPNRERIEIRSTLPDSNDAYRHDDYGLSHEDRDSVLVLDHSGSMYADDWRPSRLDGAKEASLSFCSRLASENPESRVAIVSYGSSATIHCKSTPARKVSEIQRAIESIEISGSTNIKAGLSKANQILSHSNATRQIVLLSDGQNTGNDPRQLASKLRSRATIECVGIGGQPSDVDEILMKEIASSYPDGSKRYRWIGDKQRLVAHFHNLAGRIRRT